METQLTLRRNIRCGLYACMSLTLFLVEAQIPLPVPLPGVKLGLANSVTLLVLELERPQDALAVLLVRILLSGLFSGQPVMLLYSLCGGLLSFCGMALLHRILAKELWFVSMIGSVMHIAGQLCMAGLLMQTALVAQYFPILVLFAVPAGIFNGWVTAYVVKHVRQMEQYKKEQEG